MLSAPAQTLTGEGTFAERLATTCANASAELTQRGELHGYVINSVCPKGLFKNPALCKGQSP